MGLWTGVVDLHGIERAIAIDSVTMRPLALPLFDTEDEVEAFLKYARAMGYDEPRAMSDESLNRLHTMWLEAGRPGRSVEDDGDLSPLLASSLAALRARRQSP